MSIEENKLFNLINNFKGKKIGVVGDLILDQFISGDADRISPEAPVIVINAIVETFIPGGAGNVSTNIATLGGRPYVIGVVGRDVASSQLLKELKKRKVDVSGVFKDFSRPTTQKTRVIIRGQQLARIDKEVNNNISAKIEKNIIGFISKNIKKWDTVVISDYVKGVITQNLAIKIIRLAIKHNKPVIVDTKSKNVLHFKNATILTPNQKEAVEITNVRDVEIAGKIIQKKLKSSVLITQGADGMRLFENNKISHFPANAREVFDVVGAGDTVVATLALAMATKIDLRIASIIANYAAGIVVGKIGTATVSFDELKESLK